MAGPGHFETLGAEVLAFKREFARLRRGSVPVADLNALFQVKFRAFPAPVVQPVGDVGWLLDLADAQSRADGVNGSRLPASRSASTA